MVQNKNYLVFEFRRYLNLLTYRSCTAALTLPLCCEFIDAFDHLVEVGQGHLPQVAGQTLELTLRHQGQSHGAGEGGHVKQLKLDLKTTGLNDIMTEEQSYFTCFFLILASRLDA